MSNDPKDPPEELEEDEDEEQEQPAGQTEAPPAAPIVRRSELEETGAAANGEVEELVRPKPKPVTDRTKGGEPPPPVAQPQVHTSTREPSAGWWWLAFGLVVAATVALTVHVWKERGRRASPGQDPA